MIIKRGEIYKFRVSRKETEGTEQQKNRPAVLTAEVIIPSILLKPFWVLVRVSLTVLSWTNSKLALACFAFFMLLLSILVI